MPLSVFPVASNAGARPAFEDGFGGKSGHKGIDIFAPLGTPVLAPDAGQALYIADGKPCEATGAPGLSFHLQALDGTFYYGTHLMAYAGGAAMEGKTAQVAAGDVLGWVGQTGNACATAAHLHFEEHQGGVAVDPFVDLQGAEMRADATPAPQAAQGEPAAQTSGPLTLAAKAILAAYYTLHPGASLLAAEDACRMPFAQALGESLLAPTFMGTNNWGAMQATRGWMDAHKNDAGYGAIAHRDTDARAGGYIARFQCHPSLAEGALAFLELVEGITGPLANLHAGGELEDTYAFARALYVAGYFGGTHPDVTVLAHRRHAFADGSETADDDRNVSAYVQLVSSRFAAVDGAFAAMAGETGDPTKETSGPPFAPLADRLTIGQPPHTLAHAAELYPRTPKLGMTLAECLSPAANGDGTWIFGPGKSVVIPRDAAESSTGATVAAAFEAILATAGLALAGWGVVRGAEALALAVRRRRQGT